MYKYCSSLNVKAQYTGQNVLQMDNVILDLSLHIDFNIYLWSRGTTWGDEHEVE